VPGTKPSEQDDIHPRMLGAWRSVNEVGQKRPSPKICHYSTLAKSQNRTVSGFDKLNSKTGISFRARKSPTALDAKVSILSISTPISVAQSCDSLLSPRRVRWLQIQESPSFPSRRQHQLLKAASVHMIHLTASAHPNIIHTSEPTSLTSYPINAFPTLPSPTQDPLHLTRPHRQFIPVHRNSLVRQLPLPRAIDVARKFDGRDHRTRFWRNLAGRRLAGRKLASVRGWGGSGLTSPPPPDQTPST
jgi:hypothetical protein